MGIESYCGMEDGLPFSYADMTIDLFQSSGWTLERVDELRVLPVRQVQPLLVLELHVVGRSADCCLLLVLADAVGVDECEYTQTNSPADDDGHLGGDVAWCVTRAESLRAYDVLNESE